MTTRACPVSVSRSSPTNTLKADSQRLNLPQPHALRQRSKGTAMSARAQAKDKPAPVSFKWDDAFLLDDQLTEDERMIRDTARAYAQDKLLPREPKHISRRRPTARSSTRWASSA